MNVLNFIHERFEFHSSLNDKHEGSSIGCIAAAAAEGCVPVLRSPAPAHACTRPRPQEVEIGWPPSWTSLLRWCRGSDHDHGHNPAAYGGDMIGGVISG